jgi:hypothetical protein
VDSNQDSCVFDRGWLSIKVHLHRIHQRTGVSNRTQLAAQSFAAE